MVSMRRSFLILAIILAFGGCSTFSAMGVVKGAALGITQCPPDAPQDAIDGFFIVTNVGVATGLFLLTPIAGVAYIGFEGLFCGLGRGMAEAYAKALN